MSFITQINKRRVLMGVMVLATSTSLFGSLSTSSYKWQGGVLAPNGKIYGIPWDSTKVLEILNIGTPTAVTRPPDQMIFQH